MTDTTILAERRDHVLIVTVDRPEAPNAADAVHWEANALERNALMRSEDAREGPRAFAEKRRPVWKAR